MNALWVIVGCAVGGCVLGTVAACALLAHRPSASTRRRLHLVAPPRPDDTILPHR